MHEPRPRPYPARPIPRTRAGQLGARQAGRPHGERPGDAPVHHAWSASIPVLGLGGIRRPAIAGPATAGRHRTGNTAGRAPTQVGIRTATPSLDRTTSRARRPDAGTDLRLARIGTRRSTDRAAASAAQRDR